MHVCVIFPGLLVNVAAYWLFSLCYCVYVCFSMLLLMGYFSMSLHMLFPQSTCVVFLGLLFMILFPMLLFKGVADNALFFPCCDVYVVFSVLVFRSVAVHVFLSSCCKIVVFSKLLFVGCVFYVAVKPHHLFHNVFLQF